MRRRIFAMIALGLLTSTPGLGARPLELPGSTYSYADLADLALAAPVVARANVIEAIRVKTANDVPAGKVRFFVRARVAALLKGAAGLPTEVSYLADMPLDSANRAPRLKKAEVLLFAAPAAGQQPGVLRLVAPDAQLGWSDALDGRVRKVLTAAADPQAPPRITDVGSAFNVPGTLPGESETQIFLKTANGRPISLAVLRRPQEQPRWAVALAEMVDEAAAPPQPETLLWYRLACELPRQLPAASTASLTGAEASAAQADYQLVLSGLGSCGRTRKE